MRYKILGYYLTIVFILMATYGTKAVAKDVTLELQKDVQDYETSGGRVTGVDDYVNLKGGHDATEDAWVEYQFNISEWNPWRDRFNVCVDYKMVEHEWNFNDERAALYVWNGQYWARWKYLESTSQAEICDYSVKDEYIQKASENDYIIRVKIEAPQCYGLENKSEMNLYSIRLELKLDYTGKGSVGGAVTPVGENPNPVPENSNPVPTIVDFGEIDLGADISPKEVSITNPGYGINTLIWKINETYNSVDWITPKTGSVGSLNTGTIFVKIDGSKVNSSNLSELNEKFLPIVDDSGICYDEYGLYKENGLRGDFYYIPDTPNAELTSLDVALNHPNRRWSHANIFPTIEFHEGNDITNGWEEDDRFASTGIKTPMHRRFVSIFTGFIRIDNSGDHTFFVTYNAGFRLKINNQVIIEQPEESSGTSYGTTNLGEGIYPIELAHFENYGNKYLTLEWQPPGGARVVVPENSLYNSMQVLVRATPKKPSVEFDMETIGDKVHAAVGIAKEFKVVATQGSTNVDITSYRWRCDGAIEGTKTTTQPNYNLTFEQASDYTVECQVVDAKGVESDWVSISAHAWEPPTINDSPPIDFRDDVSWDDNNKRYVGVVGKPVRFMADGQTGTSGQGENIAKFLWYLGGDWVEQLPGDFISRTYNSFSTDDSIKCKAETNYKIQSNPQNFHLRIYDTLEVDSGGPYNARAGKEAELKGSANDSYPGASIKYQWRVGGDNPVGTRKNDAATGDNADPGYIRLRKESNQYTCGQYEYNDLPITDNWSVSGEFLISDATGGDAFFIYLWANATPESTSSNGQYAIIFNDNDGEDEIQFYDNGDLLKTVAVAIPLDDSEWRPFRVAFHEGEFKVYLDYQLKMTQEVSGYETRMNNNNLFGFGACASGADKFYDIRNMKWTTGTPIYTDNSGIAQYEWANEGTYDLAFTTTVTTVEGLVLEDTEFTTVWVEAGIPMAMPGGPYRGGIAGGNFSPIQLEGNHPDFVESDDVGHITNWEWYIHDSGALELDGQDDHVIIEDVDSNFPTTEITAEFWMKSDDTTRAGTPISYASGNTTNDFIVYNYRSFNIWVNNEAVGTGVVANDGDWHHIAVTWSSSAYTIW